MLRRHKKEGVFWGVIAETNDPVIASFESNAMSLGPAGSKKTISTTVPTAMKVRFSKVVPDFKNELLPMLKEPLEERGERVRELRMGDSPDSLNPVDPIVDNLHRPGGLLDVFDDLREQTTQIQPEPNQQEGENTYFRAGGRALTGFGELSLAMIDEYETTLSSVAVLIEDRKRFEDTARWIAGVDSKGKPLSTGPMPIERASWARNHKPEELEEFVKLVRARASGVVDLMSSDDDRTYQSFITGAQQSLAPFSFGRLSSSMRPSTFRADELKESTTTLFLSADAGRPEASKNFLGLHQWQILTNMKRHKNLHTPVYFLMDEATNYRIEGLDSLLTWGRSYGIRLHLIFQDLAAFERVYGRHTLSTLLSETEIKQVLPGTRNPETLELLSKMLGDQSVISANASLKELMLDESFSESARPMMTTDEIRRSKYGLLFIRKAPPALIEPVSYAEIDPYRKQVGINPFHGKPFIKKVRVKL